MIPTKAVIKETGQLVTITGKSGNRYRVFLGGTDMRYDWYYGYELEFKEAE